MRRRSDLLGDLRAAIARLNPESTCAVGLVARWETGGAVAQVEVGSALDPAVVDSSHEYAGITLNRAIIKGSDLADAIVDWLRRTVGQPQAEYYQSRVRKTGADRWPRLVLSTRFDSRGDARHDSGPTLADGHPPFASPDEAIKRWFGGDPPMNGEARLLIEDPRARIDTIEAISPTVLRVASQLSPLAGSLELQVIFGAWNKPQVGEARQRAAAVNEVHLPELANRAHAYLISQSNELLAEQDAELPERPLTAEASLSRARRAARDIAQGEHEFVELKSWIRRGHEKGIEVVETIAAFANGTRAGHLYVGVDNRGQPEGWKSLLEVLEGAMKGVAHEARPAEAEAKLQEWLRTLIEKLQYPPQIDARLLDIDGDPIFSIDVEPATSGPPCQLDDNAILVRRGSSNRFPEHDRLRELISRQIVRVPAFAFGTF